MSRKLMLVVGGMSLVLAVSACSSGRPDRPHFDEGQPPQRVMLFVSPAGKPYRNAQAATPPIAQWFSDADTDGDGRLRSNELRDDFAAAFAEFDRDGDGDIQGPEVIYYEQEIFPEITSGRAGRRGGSRRGGRGDRAGGGGGSGQGGGRGRRGGGPGGGSAGQGQPSGQSRPQTQGRIRGAARFGLLPIHHPIMQADRDIDRRVTLEEFQNASDIRFGLLDTDGDGSVTLDQLVEMLPRRRR